jgi:uncharacterized protein
MTVRAGVHENTWGHIDINVSVGPIVAQARNILPFLLILMLIGGTVFFAASCKGSTVAFSNDSQVATLSVEVADTPSEAATGLMNRESLAENSGMLFDFKEDTETSFYMKNTSIPLSIAFIDADGKVLAIEDMEPFDLTPIDPPGPYRYAIEVNRGWFEQNGIRPGYRATIDI